MKKVFILLFSLSLLLIAAPDGMAQRKKKKDKALLEKLKESAKKGRDKVVDKAEKVGKSINKKSQKVEKALEETAKKAGIKVSQSENEPSLLLQSEAEEREAKEEADDKKKKKKRIRKNIYYGQKTRKYFVESGVGKNVKVVEFNYLREHMEPNPFVPDIHWYNQKTKKLKRTTYDKFDHSDGVLLHGPYTVWYQDTIAIEEGIYYAGMKHGRWIKHNNKYLLTDKGFYNKGFPKESVVVYYDDKSTPKKFKEITPVVYGEKHGNYYLWHENGSLAVAGKYEHDEKVGVWKEYYSFQRKRKKEVQYKEDFDTKKFVPFVKSEWDKRGDLLYESERKE